MNDKMKAFVNNMFKVGTFECAVFCGTVALVVAVLILLFGFWETVLVALLSRMYGPVNSLLNIQVDWIRSMAMFTRIFEYYDMKPEIDDRPGARELTGAKGEIVFDHVYFSYDGERMILKDISFTLHSGDCVAIVGPSGSGKGYVCERFLKLGIPSIDTDKVYREILSRENSECLSELILEFGESIISDGKLDRRALAQIVFAKGNEKKLERLLRNLKTRLE